MLIFDKCHVMDKYFHISSKHMYLVSMQLNNIQFLKSDTLLRFFPLITHVSVLSEAVKYLGFLTDLVWTVFN